MESSQTNRHDRDQQDVVVGPRQIDRHAYDLHSQVAALADEIASTLWDRPDPTKDQWKRTEPDAYEFAALQRTLAFDEAIQRAQDSGMRGTYGMPLTYKERYDLLGAYLVIDHLLPFTRHERQDLRQTVGSSSTGLSATWEAEATDQDKALWKQWDQWWWQGYAGLPGYKDDTGKKIDIVAEAAERIADVLETVLST